MRANPGLDIPPLATASVPGLNGLSSLISKGCLLSWSWLGGIVVVVGAGLSSWAGLSIALSTSPCPVPSAFTCSTPFVNRCTDY